MREKVRFESSGKRLGNTLSDALRWVSVAAPVTVQIDGVGFPGPPPPWRTLIRLKNVGTPAVIAVITGNVEL